MDERKLTTLECIMLISGSGLGTGILAIPYAASHVGLFGIATGIFAAYIISVLLHLIAADLVLHSENSSQLIGIFKEHMFCNPYGNVLSILLFIVLTIVLFFNLTIYIICASDVMMETFIMPESFSKIIFYILSSSIVFLGIKVIGISEKYSMVLIGVVVFYLCVFSIWNNVRHINLNFGNPVKILGLYGIVMFSFSALFSVPQVVNNIHDKSKIKFAVVTGIGGNALITFLFTLSVLIASKRITNVATIGLSESLSFVSKIACSIFVIFAMLTSYWSVALAQLDIIHEQTGFGKKLCWVLATAPTLFMSIFMPGGFISYIQIAGGIIAILIGWLLLPAYWKAVSGSRDELILGRIGKSKLLLLIIFGFYMIMAISSFVNI